MASSGADPFAVLGLPARADVTDDDVRSAWRRIAAATHPDRDDGGDAKRYAAAAAAYAALRTSFGRGEVLAEKAEKADAPLPRRLAGALPSWFGVPPWLRVPQRLRGFPWLRGFPRTFPRWLPRGAPARKPLRLAARLLAAAAAVTFALESTGWSPGTVAISVGAATWLIASLLRNHRERRAPKLSVRQRTTRPEQLLEAYSKMSSASLAVIAASNQSLSWSRSSVSATSSR